MNPVSGEFDVVTSELAKAAERIRGAVAPVSCYTLSSAGSSATAFGHDQLAEVFVTFCTKASRVVSQAATGDERAAGDLNTSATSYDTADSGSGGLLTGLVPSTPFPSPVDGRG